MYKWRNTGGGGSSHTLMNGGSLSVPTCDVDEFMRTYVDELQRQKLYIVEIKTPKFFMFMDVDYVGQTKLSRDEIVDVCHRIHHVIPGRCLVAVAKPKPKDNLIKSGIHIHWPDSIVDKTQAMELLEKVRVQLPDISEFIDDSVYKGSGLRMLWSHKKGKCGDEDPYVPFYNVSKQKFFENQQPSVYVLRQFSIRREESVTEIKPVSVDNHTNLEMFVYKCMDEERRFKNCKEPFDTARLTKLTRDKNMIFAQTPSKYCMNYKKCHKSNHIYYVINLDKSVMYQKCFDESCKKYEGLHHKLSLQILEEFKQDVPDVHFTVGDIYSAFAIKKE